MTEADAHDETSAASRPAGLRRELLAWALAAALLYLVFLVVQSFLSAMIWAAVLATFLHPLHRRILGIVGKPWRAALISTLASAVLLVAPTVWFGWTFVREATEVVRAAPRQQIAERVQALLDSASARLPPHLGSVDEMVGEALKSAGDRLIGWSAKLPANIAGFFLDFIVLLLTMFYLFRDGPWLLALLRDISPFGGERHDVMMRQTMDMISVTISSGFVVAAVQGVLGGSVFALLGMPSPVLWGVIMSIMAFLPFVGPWMVWLPAGIWLLVSGEVGRGVALLALGALGISLIDNVLRPVLIAGRSQLNGLLVFVSILGGLGAFGLLGVVLGPLAVATAAGMMTGYRESLVAERETRESAPV